MIEKFTKLIGVLLLGAGLVGCDSNGDTQQLSNLIAVASEGFESIQITGASDVISTGEVQSLTASAVNDGGTIVVIEGAVWSSSDNSIATVSSSGLVTGGSVDGEVVVTASFGNLTTSKAIRISSAPLSAINILFNTVSAATVEVNECSAAQFEAFGIFLGEEDEPRDITDSVSWTVNPVNALFDPVINGLLRTQAGGTLTASATFEQITGTQTVEVRDNLAGITITPDAGELTISSALQHRAIAQYSDTEDEEITDNVVWDVIDDATTDFAVVDTTLPSLGLVAASRVGAGILSASCAGVTATLPISSSSGGLIDDLTVEPDESIRVFTGSEITIFLTATTEFGGVVVEDVTEDTEWTVDAFDPNITVSNSDGSRGEVTITGPGQVVVTATFTDDDNEIFIDTATITIQ